MENIKTIIFIFMFTLLIYTINFRVLDTEDSVPAAYLPISIIKEQNFDLNEFSFYDKDNLPYYIGFKNGRYISAYPVMHSILAVPIYLPFVLLDLTENALLVKDLSKLTASILTALSVVFLYLAAERLTSKKNALIIAFVYAFATSTWVISSQALWQHGPSQLFLCIGVYFLVRGLKEKRFVLFAGFPFAMVLTIRLVDSLLVAILSLYVLHRYRKLILKYIIYALPPALFLIAYALSYHGTLSTLGQGGGLFGGWRAPFQQGFVGTLFSPSKGLFVVSPVLLFSVIGMIYAWKGKGDRNFLFKYLSICIIAFIILRSFWQEWWGGWCYGYRYMVDIAPFLCLLLIPVFNSKLFSRRFILFVFIFLLAISIIIQLIGVYSFDFGWHLGFDKYPWDPSTSFLFSVEDSQIVFYIKRGKFYNPIDGLNQRIDEYSALLEKLQQQNEGSLNNLNS